jgi:hypothetical protein
MKGIHASPHYLQIIILLFSSFYLLASCTASIYEAITSCRYLANDHDDANETNHEYSIDCIGSSITASSYGITALLTLFGVMVAAITGADVDLMIAFVIFGILVSYTSDVYTNLRINCVAGDTTSQNMWDDDQYDSAAQKCEILTYGAIGGTIGVIGGFVGGFYGVLMKLRPGTFYVQRPLGLLVALAGYSCIYCFNMLATALPYCHYYKQGKEDQIPDNIPPRINDDLVYNQLDPLCEGYRNTSIGYGAGVFISLLGIPVMFRFKKRGLWIILGFFMAICSASNRFTFMAAKLSSCDSTKNLLSDLGAYSSYQEKLFANGCHNYSNAATVSIFATIVGSSAALISLIDTFFQINHDTFIIRFRRALFFAFGFCFSLANLFNLHGSYYADCELYEKKLADDVVYEESDDVVMQAKCHGKLTQTIFYGFSIVACGIGIPVSLIYNFPVDNDKEITIMNLDDREADPEELLFHHHSHGGHSDRKEEYAKLLQEDEEEIVGKGGGAGWVKGNEDHRILVKSYRV